MNYDTLYDLKILKSIVKYWYGMEKYDTDELLYMMHTYSIEDWCHQTHLIGCRLLKYVIRNWV